ncbi:MAG TPA: hypothetical protein V6D28_14160 [Leptolyngbyaceae cyanobacterium]
MYFGLSLRSLREVYLAIAIGTGISGIKKIVKIYWPAISSILVVDQNFPRDTSERPIVN